MPKKYYRGHNQQYATFWVSFRALPYEKHFAAFVEFYREIEEAVLIGRCTLREAGYALEPIYYDEILQASPHAADMTMVGILASELADWVFESRQEAEEDWARLC